ncbi:MULTISPECIES: TAXI family TRAP transporter solute-binding subunit [Rhodomicrobium]|uniref:TAXI family TRAP transporter solute-binding subunit n=1 Tax=Rhodomicrobium TaxID=1068 RepID=UPI001FDAA802|nr:MULTISPECIES: TAXI family TRAP transporter solute-binding subunit [Rhodomicrobium]
MRNFNHRVIMPVALLALGALTLGGTGAAKAQSTQISIVTGGTGGVYYPMGGGLANILTKALPGIQATAEVTGGSVDNLKAIGAGQAEVGFSMVDAGLDAANGQGKFTAKLPIRTLAVIYPNVMHVATTEATGIKSVGEMKGKRVSTGSPGSATEVMALRVLEAAGLDPDKDINRTRLGASESVSAIKDGKIDAFFWVGGLPTAAITDLAATPNTTLKLIDHSDLVEKMNAKHGKLYAATPIGKSVYPGQTADNKASSVWNVLVVNENMSEKMAYDIIKTVFDKQDDLIAVHKEAANIKLDNQKTANTGGIPFHPGAVKFLAEKGVKVE